MKGLRQLHLLVAPLGLGSKVTMDAPEHEEATRVHLGFAAYLQELTEEIDKATCDELESLAAAIDKGIAELRWASALGPHGGLGEVSGEPETAGGVCHEIYGGPSRSRKGPDVHGSV